MTVAQGDADNVTARRTIRWRGRAIPVVGPNIRDPRIHLSITILAIITIGMAWLDFRLSIPHVLVPLAACGALELVHVYRAEGIIAWPASAFQTATSTALLLRLTDFEHGDWWSFQGWYYFAGISVAGVLTKYYVRHRGRHVFNPSNVALVVAFLVFGSERLEPLDYWWAPFGWGMFAAYAVIFIGGILICRRLRLIEMGIAFYVTFVAGVAVLALLGQSITTRWSLTPISGAHFWWILATSPETLIFLYFMITDPKTTPDGRGARILFGCSVGVMSTVLLAPWQTEFGTKVGFLSGLLVVTAVRPFVERWVERRAEHHAQPQLQNAWDRPRSRLALAGASAAASTALFLAVVAVAGHPNRIAASSEPPPPEIEVEVEPKALPTVTIDDDVAGLSAELATQPGAQALAAALAFNLEVEAEAIMNRDPSLLPAVTDGQRLQDVTTLIESQLGGDIVVPTYEFDTMHLSIVYPGGLQRGANAGLTVTGTVTWTTYSPDGTELDVLRKPIDMMFSLRETTSGRWLTTATPDPSIAR